MNNRQEQALFLQRIKEVTETAARNGNAITPEELEEAFADLSLDESQMLKVREYLHAANIGIGEPLPAEDVLTDEEKNHLEEYEALIEAIEIPSDNVLDAVKLSAMAGEADAKKRLTEYSLKKVVDIARLYAGQGVYMEDLIGAGNEALLIAVSQLAPLEKPDEVDGFIGRKIMDAMEDLIAMNLDVRAAEKTVEEKVNLIADRARELAEELGRKVSVSELAKEYEMDPEEIEEALRLSGNAIADISPSEA